MASPEGESFYCISNRTLSDERGQIYAYTGMATAFLGFLGSLFQIVQWRTGTRRLGVNDGRESVALLQRSPNIIFWLALSDFFACALVIANSIAFLYIKRPQVGENQTGLEPFPAVNPSWGLPLEYGERYFFVCTYLWTFCYAVDIMLKLKGRQPNEKYFHLIWLVSGFLIGISIFCITYKDSNKCALCDQIQLSYISSWIPLLLVMVGNPVIYTVSMRFYKQALFSRGIFTDHERQLLHGMKVKFAAMMAVFYFCWWTSILVLTVSIVYSCSHYYLKGTVLIISSFFNPLQGLLNWFVYGRHSWFVCLAGRTSYIRIDSQFNEKAPSSRNSVEPASGRATPMSVTFQELSESGSYTNEANFASEKTEKSSLL